MTILRVLTFSVASLAVLVSAASFAQRPVETQPSSSRTIFRIPHQRPTEEMHRLSVRRLIISDIDDTLRTTNVRNKTGLAMGMVTGGGAFDTRNSFAGMSRLLNVTMEDGREKSLNPTIFYVTGTPFEVTQEVAGRFLRESGFPLGVPVFRKADPRNVSDGFVTGRILGLPDIVYFKKNAILKLAGWFPNADLILLGDNGDDDIVVFNEVREELKKTAPRRVVHQFIHEVHAYHVEQFNDKMTARVFVTAADLAQEFFERGLISELSLAEVIDEVQSSMETAPDSVFPRWLRCNWVPYLKRPITQVSDRISSVRLREQLRGVLHRSLGHCLKHENR